MILKYCTFNLEGKKILGGEILHEQYLECHGHFPNFSHEHFLPPKIVTGMSRAHSTPKNCHGLLFPVPGTFPDLTRVVQKCDEEKNPLLLCNFHESGSQIEECVYGPAIIRRGKL